MKRKGKKNSSNARKWVTLIRFHPDCFRKCFTFLFRKLFFYYSSLPSSHTLPLLLGRAFLLIPTQYFAFALCVLSCLRFYFMFVVHALIIVSHQSSFHSSILVYVEHVCDLREKATFLISYTQWLMSIKWGKEKFSHTLRNAFYCLPPFIQPLPPPTCHTLSYLCCVNKSTTLISQKYVRYIYEHENFLWQIYEAFTMTKLVNDVSHKEMKNAFRFPAHSLVIFFLIIFKRGK